MRPRIIIPGMGDVYAYTPGQPLVIVPAVAGIGVEGAAPAALPVAAVDEDTGMQYSPMGPPDPVLERERAILGGMILGEFSWPEAERLVRHVDHRRILDAFDGAYIFGLELAGNYCRSAGLPPELCGAYLAGCVAAWEASVEEAKRKASPVQPEGWQERGARDDDA